MRPNVRAQLWDVHIVVARISETVVVPARTITAQGDVISAVDRPLWQGVVQSAVVANAFSSRSVVISTSGNADLVADKLIHEPMLIRDAA